MYKVAEMLKKVVKYLWEIREVAGVTYTLVYFFCFILQWKIHKILLGGVVTLGTQGGVTPHRPIEICRLCMVLR